jgi:hypothetical protein
LAQEALETEKAQSQTHLDTLECTVQRDSGRAGPTAHTAKGHFAMNAETTSPEPAQMTEFERRVLSLLESIDSRLKSIDATADWFYERIRGVDRSQQAMREMSDRFRRP